jgi:hypothetical protein
MSPSVARGIEPEKVLCGLGSTHCERKPDGRTDHLVTPTSANIVIGRRTKFQEYCYRGRISVLLGHARDIWLILAQR